VLDRTATPSGLRVGLTASWTPDDQRHVGGARYEAVSLDKDGAQSALRLAQARGALTSARDGSGSILFVVGEPGIGKTSVAQELARGAAWIGMPAVWGSAIEAEGSPLGFVAPNAASTRSLTRRNKEGDTAPYGAWGHGDERPRRTGMVSSSAIESAAERRLQRQDLVARVAR
jgi:hypothetical protein